MKKEDVLRKRNLQLVQEIEDLKTELEQQKEINSSLNINALIQHVENIKSELLSSINEIENLKDEYKTLIYEMKEFRRTM